MKSLIYLANGFLLWKEDWSKLNLDFIESICSADSSNSNTGFHFFSSEPGKIKNNVRSSVLGSIDFPGMTNSVLRKRGGYRHDIPGSLAVQIEGEDWDNAKVKNLLNKTVKRVAEKCNLDQKQRRMLRTLLKEGVNDGSVQPGLWFMIFQR